MSNPFYSLDEDTKNLVLAMIETCRANNHGNFNFHYYQTHEHEAVDFFLSEHKFGWELTVKQEKKLSGISYILFDIYTVSCGEIKYNYSEKEIA